MYARSGRLIANSVLPVRDKCLSIEGYATVIVPGGYKTLRAVSTRWRSNEKIMRILCRVTKHKLKETKETTVNSGP